MAEIIDLQDDDSLENDNTNLATENPPEDNSPSTEEQEAKIPEKYQGKTLEEIIKMHQEAEKLIGRQAQEVGETRKLADDLIRQQLERSVKAPESQSVTQEIDFFDDPKKAVNQAIESNPILKQFEEQLQRQKQIEALQRVEKQHPDFVQIDSTQEFKEWISGSKIRQKLYNEAANFDADAAIELLDTYKSLKGIKAQTVAAADEGVKQVSEQQRNQAIKAAGVQTGGTGESTKPIYRYADIMKMMTNDRKQYNARADEFLEAYREGRIKGRPS